MGKRQGRVRTETSREREAEKQTDREDLLSDVFEKARLRHTGRGGWCVCVCVARVYGGISPKTALFFLGGS